MSKEIKIPINYVNKQLACSRRLDSGEQVKSYAASTKRNTRGKKRGETGAGARKPPSLLPPYFFPRQFFAGALIFCQLPTIRTPGTG